jgi:uncharacterized protein YndB with AHSA1/START domain
MGKWIVIAVGVVVAVFLTLGAAMPQIKVVSRATIGRSPAVVWRVFTDEARTKEWLSGLRSMETISGAPLTVGSQHRLTLMESGEKMQMLEVVTAVEPEKLYAFDSAMEELKGHTDVTLARNGTGTEIVFDAVYDGGSLLQRSLMVLMQPQMQERQGKNLAKLKALVEAEPAG